MHGEPNPTDPCTLFRGVNGLGQDAMNVYQATSLPPADGGGPALGPALATDTRNYSTDDDNGQGQEFFVEVYEDSSSIDPGNFTLRMEVDS